jgi:hypothetical protein
MEALRPESAIWASWHPPGNVAGCRSPGRAGPPDRPSGIDEGVGTDRKAVSPRVRQTELHRHITTFRTGKRTVAVGLDEVQSA